jgi:hypothetical protein
MNQDQDMVVATLRPVSIVIDEQRPAARTALVTRTPSPSRIWMAYSASLAVFVSGLALHAMASMSTHPLFASAARASSRRAPAAAKYQPTVESLAFTLRRRSAPSVSGIPSVALVPKSPIAARSTRQAPAPVTVSPPAPARVRGAAGAQAMTDEVTAAAETLARARREQSLK